MKKKKTTTLSNRLTALASWVPQGARLADIGSDHAYLPLYLLERGQIQYAVAGEVVAGPYQSALKNVAEAGAQDAIAVRLADGLAAIELADAIDTVTIAGMGGRLIRDILAQGEDQLAGVSHLLLQPNNREEELRTWLVENGYKLAAEGILEEKGKIYEYLWAQTGKSSLTDRDLRFGPYLLKEKSEVFIKKWLKEQAKLEKALAAIPAIHEQERLELTRKIQEIKEVLDES